MFDDEIQCLGTRPTANGPTAPHDKDTVIMLSVEKWGDVPARSLVFKNSESFRSMVHIGRPRSAVKSDVPPDGAWFRCPVVSRNHAKIKFEDGQVFLIDLKSYHGTHVRKPWETSSTQLAPFIQYPLSTGDEITFGKKVGTNDGLVPPVVAHVSLIKTQTTAQATPTPSPLAPVASQHESRRSSGCYGIHNDNVSSTSASSNNSDSDIEEIPKSPSADPLPEPLQSSQPYFNLIRQLLPPKASLPAAAGPCSSQIPCVPKAISVQPSEDATVAVSALQTLRDIADLSQPEYNNPKSKEDSVGLESSMSPSEMISSVSAHASDSHLYLGHQVQNISTNEEIASERGQQMTPEVNPALEEEDMEGNLCVTSVAVTRTDDAHSAFATPERAAQSEAGLDNFLAIEMEENDTLVNSKTEVDNHKAGELQQDGKDVALGVARSNPGGIGNFVSMEELQSALAPLRADINELQSQRRKHKTRHDTNFRSLTDQYNDLEERMTEMNGLHTTLSDQTENLAHVDLPEVQALVGAIQDKIDLFMPMEESIKDSLTRIQSISDTVDGIKAMCDEWKSDAEAKLAKELEALKQVHANVLAATEDPTAVASLKRKRSMLDDDDRETVNTCASSADPMTGDSALDGNALDTIDSPPLPKRSRGIATTAIQTATAITLGAVATWGILAFS